MKYLSSLLIAGVLALLAFVLFEWALPRAVDAPVMEETPTAPSLQTYMNADKGISFQYPDTYELKEEVLPGSGMRERIAVTLTRRADLPVPEASEGPPAISLLIVQNSLDSQTTEGWVRSSAESNFKLSPDGTLASTTVDGREALLYRWDGLYLGTTVARAERAWIYALSVTFLSPEDAIVADFARIIQSVDIR